MSYQLMIKEGKIVGISQSLLKEFKINSLFDLIQKKEIIEKIFQNIYSDKPIALLNKKIKIKKEPFFNTINIEILNVEILKELEDTIENRQKENFDIKIIPEEEFEIKIDLPEIEKTGTKEITETTDTTLNLNVIDNTNTFEKPNNETNIQTIIEEPIKKEIPCKTNMSKEKENIINNVPEVQKEELKPKKIQLNFKNEILKIKEILTPDKKENFIKKEIDKEIENATKELGLDKETLKEMAIDIFKQVINAEKELKQAIEKKDYKKIHSISHKLKGGALNLRLEKLAFALKTIDELSKKQEDISIINEIVENILLYTKKAIQKPQEAIFSKNTKKTIKLNQKQKNVIQKYLTNATEENFRKDKEFFRTFLKYPELNSLEELRKLIIS